MQWDKTYYKQASPIPCPMATARVSDIYTGEIKTKCEYRVLMKDTGLLSRGLSKKWAAIYKVHERLIKEKITEHPLCFRFPNFSIEKFSSVAFSLCYSSSGKNDFCWPIPYAVLGQLIYLNYVFIKLILKSAHTDKQQGGWLRSVLGGGGKCLGN